MLVAQWNGVEGLYREHHAWLQGWLRRRLSCSALAADLAQDTFVRLLTRPKDEALREPRAFLASAAKCILIDHYRRSSLEQAFLSTLAQLPICFSPSPEERALLLETLTEIDTMLDGLPSKVRRAFLLVQLDGLPYAEVAAQLGVSISAIKKYLTQAMTQCLLYQLQHAS